MSESQKDENVKLLSELTRADWLKYNWYDATVLDGLGRKFIRGNERSPSEVLQAAAEWEAFSQ